MSFPAKFGGTCAKCAGHIPVGAMVNYDGKAIRHAPRCPAKGTVTEVSAPAERKNDGPLGDDARIIGRASYKGKSGYLVLWHGITKDGKRATKLAFRDGSKTFWGNGDVCIEKMYDEPISLGKLNRLAEEYRAEKEHLKASAVAQDAAPASPSEPPEQRIDRIDAILAGTGRVRATRDDGAGPVTDTLSFTRRGKNAPIVGEVISHTRKGKSSPSHYVVVSVDAPYYTSRRDAREQDEMNEDMDYFDAPATQVGWSVSYAAIRVQPNEVE